MIYVALFLLGQAGTAWALWLAQRDRQAAEAERARLLTVILSLENGRPHRAIEVAAEGAGQAAPSAPREPREPEYPFVNGIR